jgi:hypothetical protein
MCNTRTICTEQRVAGEYAGAVIGVLVALFLLLVVGIYFAINTRNEQLSSGFASDTHTVVTTNQV